MFVNLLELDLSGMSVFSVNGGSEIRIYMFCFVVIVMTLDIT